MNLTSPLQLPKITSRRTPPINSQFKEAYDNCDLAVNMIKQRLNRIQYEKQQLLSRPSPYANNYNRSNFIRNPYQYPYQPNSFFGPSYDLRMMSNARGQLMSPNLYTHQTMDPIYYPLEMPVSGEPIALPNIEVGAPSQRKGNLSFGIKEIAEMVQFLDEHENMEMVPPDKQKAINFFGPGSSMRQLNNIFGNNNNNTTSDMQKTTEQTAMEKNYEGNIMNTEFSTQRFVTTNANINP